MATSLVAVALIVVVAQLLGELAQRWQQPRVIGEIVGGIVLGPSLLGAVAPDLEAHLFTPEVRSQLDLLGQLGLVLFMFLIGLELNPKLLQGRIPLASRITSVGVLLPLGLGVCLAMGFEQWQPQLLPGDRALSGALFMGTAMAITAFPVLARILKERGLMNQPLGALAITAAALEDVVSWVLLAVVVAIARSSSWAGVLLPLVGTAAWSWLLLVGLRPLRRWLEHRYRQGHQLGPLLQTSLFGGALFSAAVTEWIGVHAIFGAFLWGLAMPRYEPLRRRLELRLEAVVLQLLLPLFFAISGLSTRIGSLNSGPLWTAALLVLVLAVLGKFLGAWAMARLSGIEPREAQALGWLMNTRGLTELVILNVGLGLGVISTELFTMGVLMALVTTVMTGPLLSRLGYGPTG
ncbi:cation:proton antiporter [Cyanobium sp. WAJ14-Wanaka]|uniref:cation:proton antiporter n=1 Tax=Cyanobium sp. WAJ14-Wanaka TaxID=2823725 RepID=UPI0020CD93E5|nr:cation:proton antiporter [Cyanobium sp. WAJ14-Wanaka]MCP9774344.1 cation:proton antiporter [Cyanobium sp. WAJ14-Wanaka]